MACALNAQSRVRSILNRLHVHLILNRLHVHSILNHSWAQLTIAYGLNSQSLVPSVQ